MDGVGRCCRDKTNKDVCGWTAGCLWKLPTAKKNPRPSPISCFFPLTLSLHMHRKSKPARERTASRAQTMPTSSSQAKQAKRGRHSAVGSPPRSRGGAEVPATDTYADARKPCVQPRTQLGKPNTPIGSQYRASNTKKWCY